jgi:hypothetical protein
MNHISFASKNSKGENYIDRIDRIKPNNLILVMNSATQEVIGEVVNINEEGMKVIMPKEMYLNQTLEITLVVKNEITKKQYIMVVSELMWVEKIAGKEQVYGGFYFKNKSFKSKFRLNQLIKDL